MEEEKIMILRMMMLGMRRCKVHEDEVVMLEGEDDDDTEDADVEDKDLDMSQDPF